MVLLDVLKIKNVTILLVFIKNSRLILFLILHHLDNYPHVAVFIISSNNYSDNYTVSVPVLAPTVNPKLELNNSMLNVTAFPGCLLEVFPKELNPKMPN